MNIKRKPLFFLSFLVVLFGIPGLCSAAENKVDRTRVIMARIASDASPLESKIDATTAIKYVDAFLTKFRPDLLTDEDGNPVAIGDIPNNTKASVYINQLRDFHKKVYRSYLMDASIKTAKSTVNQTVSTDNSTDFGSYEDESIEQ